jgi:hypothetical protein
MTHGLLPCMIGTQEVIILFSVLIPVVVIYVLIRGFLKGYRQSKG